MKSLAFIEDNQIHTTYVCIRNLIPDGVKVRGGPPKLGSRIHLRLYRPAEGVVWRKP